MPHSRSQRFEERLPDYSPHARQLMTDIALQQVSNACVCAYSVAFTVQLTFRRAGTHRSVSHVHTHAHTVSHILCTQMGPLVMDVLSLEDTEVQWDLQSTYGEPSAQAPCFGAADGITGARDCFESQRPSLT